MEKKKAQPTSDSKISLLVFCPSDIILSGAVVYVRFEEGNGKLQFVVVRLDRGFRLHSNSVPPA